MATDIPVHMMFLNRISALSYYLSILYLYQFSDERLPDENNRTEREKKQIQVEVSRAQKWADMINQDSVKKYFGPKVSKM